MVASKTFRFLGGSAGNWDVAILSNELAALFKVSQKRGKLKSLKVACPLNKLAEKMVGRFFFNSRFFWGHLMP